MDCWLLCQLHALICVKPLYMLGLLLVIISLVPRFYLTAVETIDFPPQLQDKIWEWPGNEARQAHTLGGFRLWSIYWEQEPPPPIPISAYGLG